jgi:hypothetical protein
MHGGKEAGNAADNGGTFIFAGVESRKQIVTRVDEGCIKHHTNRTNKTLIIQGRKIC